MSRVRRQDPIKCCYLGSYAAASSETAYSGDWAARLRVIVVAQGLLFNLVLHAEALAFDDDRVGVVQDAVEDGGGQRAVVVEDLGPMFVGAVGGDHHRCALVALADDLEQ